MNWLTWFLFLGDMVVMLFMVAVATWVFWRLPDSAQNEASRIPLDDEAAVADGPLAAAGGPVPGRNPLDEAAASGGDAP